MVVYLFLINGVLWAWQWSDYASTICNTNRLTVLGNMCTKFHKDISIFTQVTACIDGRTDSHPDFNSSLHRDHLYTGQVKSSFGFN